MSGLDGVDKTEIDFESEILTITMKEGKTLTEESLKKAFKDSRFKVTSFETVKEDAEKKEEKEEKKEEDAEEGETYSAGIGGIG